MPPVVVNISRLASADHTGYSSSCASNVTRIIVVRDESNIQMSHLGRFTGTLTAEVQPDNTSTGTFTFIAANGDQLSGTFVGEGVFMPPNTATRNEIAKIENGTGRLAGATGTFTMVTVDTIDFATGKATGYGSFEGRINLNK
jgi:hypothetical protein